MKLEDREVACFIREHTADMAFFVGEQLADEIASWMTVGYGTWIEAGRTLEGARRIWLEFTAMTQYNQLFVELCERLAKHNSASFDRSLKMREFAEFWHATQGVVYVPGQRAWYAAHPEFADESRLFEVLVKHGQTSTRDYALV